MVLLLWCCVVVVFINLRFSEKAPFDPRNIDHDEEDDDNGDDGNGDDGNGDDGNGDDGNGDDNNGNIVNGNPNLNNGNQGNSNLTQTPINNNYYNPVYNAIRQLGLTIFIKIIIHIQMIL